MEYGLRIVCMDEYAERDLEKWGAIRERLDFEAPSTQMESTENLLHPDRTASTAGPEIRWKSPPERYDPRIVELWVMRPHTGHPLIKRTAMAFIRLNLGPFHEGNTES
ncbi:hypothetical protein NDU88_008116 [Pleurodeles waltl]|uniref:Uncharacterized protein n=1 Tax=Pleurodeles waltl TaxID=8319 RepID=A0AAV7NV12_PLEWA|nr:hypothetical protein NDU88_008116 [Pleurodeles waltl]